VSEGLDVSEGDVALVRLGLGVRRGVEGLTPVDRHSEYDEERLETLASIRAAFLDFADAGDEGAARIVRAVEGMMAEVEEWIRLR
jgi:hypothetical protein